MAELRNHIERRSVIRDNDDAIRRFSPKIVEHPSHHLAHTHISIEALLEIAIVLYQHFPREIGPRTHFPVQKIMRKKMLDLGKELATLARLAFLLVHQLGVIH